MFKSFKASIDEVGSRNRVEVIDIGPKSVEDFCGVFGGDSGHFEALSCNFQYIFVVQKCFLVVVGTVESREIRGLEGGEGVIETVRDVLASVQLIFNLQTVDG